MDAKKGSRDCLQQLLETFWSSHQAALCWVLLSDSDRGQGRILQSLISMSGQRGGMLWPRGRLQNVSFTLCAQADTALNEFQVFLIC